VENNILLGDQEGSFHPHVWYASSGDIFRNNIVATAYKPINMPRAAWGKTFDNNVLHTLGIAAPRPASELQQASGRDEHSLVADVMFIDPARGNYRVKEGSPALALGFKNFPLDQFGVTDPKLKAIARTPFSAPTAVTDSRPPAARDASPRDFLGAKIKNVVGAGEVSAYGLPSEAGAAVIEVASGSPAARAGLQERDVIREWQGRDVGGVDDLLQFLGGTAKGARISLGVWRLQQTVTVDVTFE
jgi:hypothetical protein